MVDERCVGAALGLGALARIVDEERVDHGQVCDRLVGEALGGHAERLAGEPFEVAVLAHVDDGIGTEVLAQPQVGGEVMVRGREIRVVVDADRVVTEAARWLHHHHDVAKAQPGHVDVLRLRVDVQLAGGLTPSLLHLFAYGFRERVEVPLVRLGRHAEFVLLHDLRREPLGIVTTGFDDGTHECVAVEIGVARNIRGIAEVIARLFHSVQDAQRGSRSVQAHGVTDAGVLGGVRRQHDGGLLVLVFLQAQHRRVDGDAGQAGATLGVGVVGNEAVGTVLLEAERHGDDATVEFWHGNLAGNIHRRQAIGGFLPLVTWGGQRQTLDDRNIHLVELLDVPGLVVATGTHSCGLRTAGGEHGSDNGVAGGQNLEELRIRLAQGCRVDRNRDSPVCCNRLRQCLDVGGVAGELLGTVVNDADARAAVSRGLVAREVAPHGQVHRCLEAEAGE